MTTSNEELRPIVEAATTSTYYHEGCGLCYGINPDAEHAFRQAITPAKAKAMLDQIDALENGIRSIVEKLKLAGANLPIDNKGTIESSMQSGLSIALCVVENVIEDLNKKDPS